MSQPGGVTSPSFCHSVTRQSGVVATRSPVLSHPYRQQIIARPVASQRRWSAVLTATKTVGNASLGGRAHERRTCATMRCDTVGGVATWACLTPQIPRHCHSLPSFARHVVCKGVKLQQLLINIAGEHFWNTRLPGTGREHGFKVCARRVFYVLCFRPAELKPERVAGGCVRPTWAVRNQMSGQGQTKDTGRTLKTRRRELMGRPLIDINTECPKGSGSGAGWIRWPDPWRWSSGQANV